jgi:Family of unknown function (DUF6183)
MEPGVEDLIEAADMNALLRVIDGYCASRRWDDLLDLADRCEEALERGKQLWPIAAHVDYRIALEAPGDYAAGVLDSDLARFTLGPLTEVAASTHTWDELAPHIDVPHIAAYVAQERVLRSEDLTDDERAHAEVLELPLRLLGWEPTYALAQYRSNVVEVAEPWDPKAPLKPTERRAGQELDEDEITNALIGLAHQWTAESNGAARAVTVDGDAVGAVSLLTLEGLRMGPIEPAEALQRMAWAAASGGAHGRRRGAALGRSLAWHVGALLCDVEWPAEPEGFRAALNELQWYRWDEGAPEQGWSLRLAMEDPQHGWAAAVAATDLLEE